MKEKEKSLSVLIKEADKVFADWIRKSSKVNGIYYCFVCGKPTGYVHAAHFIDRDQMPTRYDEMNVHGACISCNMFDDDHKAKYNDVMVFQYGARKVQDLIDKSRSLAKFTRSEIADLMETYSTKIKEL